MDPERAAAPDFGSVLETMSDAMIIADANNVVVYANAALTQLLGWKPDEIVGKTISDTLVPERLRAQHLNGFSRYIQTSHPTLIGQTIRLPARASDGTEVHIELALSRARASDGSVLMVGGLRDVRDRLELERQSALVTELLEVLARPDSLEETATRLLQAICSSLGWEAAAIWMLDRPTKLLECVQFWSSPSVNTPEFEALTRKTVMRKGVGLPGRVWETGEAAWIENVANEFQFPRRSVALSEGLHCGLGLPISSQGRFVGVAEFFSRQVLPRQQELIDTMTSIGEPLGDFLADRAATEELAFQNALLEAQSEASFEGILVVSPRGEMIYFNRKFIEMWNIPEDVVESRSDKLAQEAVLDNLVDPQGFLDRIEYLYGHPDQTSGDELRLVDGRVIERNSAPVPATDGSYHGRVWFFRDITEQRRAVEELAAVAHVLQQSLLPPQLPDIPGIELAALYRPGKEGSEVGGDFYDAFRLTENEWALVIGDVLGKGAAAATLTGLARHTLQAAAALDPDPKQGLSLVNNAFLTEGSGRFCTISYARVRQQGNEVVATIWTAGHPPPFVLHPGGEVEAIEAHGDLLGVLEEPDLTPATVVISPGDALVFYTDGLADLIDRWLAPDVSLPEILAQLPIRKPSDIIAALEDLADKVISSRHQDDIAALVAAVRFGTGSKPVNSAKT